MLLKNTTQITAILGALLTAGFAICAAKDAEIGSIPFLAAAILWATSPYAALIVLAQRASGRHYWATVLVISTFATLAFGLYFFWLGFFVHPDPQSGLLFVLLPFYQLAFVGALFLASMLLRGGSRQPQGRR